MSGYSKVPTGDNALFVSCAGMPVVYWMIGIVAFCIALHAYRHEVGTWLCAYWRHVVLALVVVAGGCLAVIVGLWVYGLVAGMIRGTSEFVSTLDPVQVHWFKWFAGGTILVLYLAWLISPSGRNIHKHEAWLAVLVVAFAACVIVGAISWIVGSFRAALVSVPWTVGAVCFAASLKAVLEEMRVHRSTKKCWVVSDHLTIRN